MNKSIIAALPLSLAALTATAAEHVKPNILWIITDDERADALACWNRAKTGKSESALGYVSSPNLDKLAEEGVLYTRAYCNSPLSGPSRASMHTGKYPHHNGAFDFQMKHHEYEGATPLVPEVMRSAGYNATAFGKIGYYIYKYMEERDFIYSDDDYEQTNSERDIERSYICDFNYPKATSEDADKIRKIETWYNPDGSKIEYAMYKDIEDEPEYDRNLREEYYKNQEVIISPRNRFAMGLGGESTMPTDRTEDGRIYQVVSEYLENENAPYKSITGKSMQGADTNKPQFIHLGFHFPHTPVLPSKEYRDMFKKHTYKIPDYDPAQYDNMPKSLQGWHNNYAFTDFTAEQQQQMVQDYYAFCAMGDEMIGRAVDDFKAYCAKNDQPYLIVVACGDHGWHLGEQGSYFKMASYLKSNETAVIVVSSDKERFPAGKVVDDIAEYVDFAPTFYEAAGIDTNNGEFDYLDGRDLSATANNKIKPREYTLGEVGTRAFMRSKDFAFSMNSRPKGIPTLDNMPNNNIKWALECSLEDVDMGLYDLRVDPYESNNLANDERYKDLAAWFRTKLGNIVLGDNRFEIVWSEKNVWDISSFAAGSDDKKLNIPKKLIPKVE